MTLEYIKINAKFTISELSKMFCLKAMERIRRCNSRVLVGSLLHNPRLAWRFWYTVDAEIVCWNKLWCPGRLVKGAFSTVLPCNQFTHLPETGKTKSRARSYYVVVWQLSNTNPGYLKVSAGPDGVTLNVLYISILITHCVSEKKFRIRLRIRPAASFVSVFDFRFQSGSEMFTSVPGSDPAKNFGSFRIRDTAFYKCKTTHVLFK
jgi:hypothetical protein